MCRITGERTTETRISRSKTTKQKDMGGIAEKKEQRSKPGG